MKAPEDFALLMPVCLSLDTTRSCPAGHSAEGGRHMNGECRPPLSASKTHYRYLIAAGGDSLVTGDR